MKVYISIITAMISFFTASYPSETGGPAIEKGYCPEYVYYLQECNSNSEMPSHALAAECNFSFQQPHEGKPWGQTFSKYFNSKGINAIDSFLFYKCVSCSVVSDSLRLHGL